LAGVLGEWIESHVIKAKWARFTYGHQNEILLAYFIPRREY